MKRKAFIKYIKYPIFLMLCLQWSGTAFSFSGDGPYNHLEITRRALQKFAERSGYEISYACSEWLIKGNLYNDNATNTLRETYHCVDNDIPGCSFRLDHFKGKALRAPTPALSLFYMGQAFHIVQDFYSHTNWVENYGFSMILAPISTFKDIAPPHNIQSGYYPDLYFVPEQQLACLSEPKENWNQFIPGNTHLCSNKDDNDTLRGGAFVPNTAVTYHELAGEYAIKQSIQLMEYFWHNNHWLQTCVVPVRATGGCNNTMRKWSHPLKVSRTTL